MGTEKKQTAVDYLFEKLFDNYESLHHGKIELHTFFELNMKNRDEAQKMDREQKLDAWLDGSVDGDVKDFDHYYERTYINTTLIGRGMKEKLSFRIRLIFNVICLIPSIIFIRYLYNTTNSTGMVNGIIINAIVWVVLYCIVCIITQTEEEYNDYDPDDECLN